MIEKPSGLMVPIVNGVKLPFWVKLLGYSVSTMLPMVIPKVKRIA